MSKPVIMTPEQWCSVLGMIKQREKPSVYLSRNKMKDVLGFTVRDHREYMKDPEYVKQPLTGEWHDLELGWYEGKMNVHTVRLDFYDEQKRTMFLLKYGNGGN
jgi:hypothetical protein